MVEVEDPREVLGAIESKGIWLEVMAEVMGWGLEGVAIDKSPKASATRFAEEGLDWDARP